MELLLHHITNEKAPPVQNIARQSTKEWITFGLIVLCYIGWAITLIWLSGVWAVLALTLLLVLHSSLTHEALHGHPFRRRWINEALMSLPIGLAVPYNRFRDLHLAHHMDSNLTDPYDDPESNYLDPAHWARLPRWYQQILRFNNTLLGRITVGTVIGQASFMAADWRAARAGDRAAVFGWSLHLIGLVPVIYCIALSPVSFPAYLLAAYLALSILRIRTFLEHRAHEKSRGRTVIVEDRGILAFLFLNNNLHVVHHMHPQVAWYDLPALYLARKDYYLATNEGYLYHSYAEVLARFFWRAKDPVPHPLWPKE